MIVNTRFIRTVCIVLVCAVLVLASTLTIAAQLGLFDRSQNGPSDTDKNKNDPDIDPELEEWLKNNIYKNAVDLSGGLTNDDAPPQSLEVMTISSEYGDKLYLKVQSFQDLNGNEWSKAITYESLLFEEYSADYIRGYKKRSEYKHSLNVVPIIPLGVMAYYPGVEDGDLIHIDDVLATSNGLEPYSLTYVKCASETATSSNKLSSYEREYREHVYQNYLQIDEIYLDYMKALIKQNGLNSNDGAIAEKVRDLLLMNTTYTLDYNSALDKEETPIIAFFDKYKEGNSQHFASFATLLFRAMGIPARYTVGFYAPLTANTDYTVTGKDYMAWVEIYEDGLGWRYVDVTGRDIEALPDDPVNPDDPVIPDGPGEGENPNGGDTSLDISGAPGEPSNTPIFNILSSTTGRLYLKSQNGKDFNGHGWTLATPYGMLLDGKYSADYLRNYTTFTEGSSSALITPLAPVYLQPYYTLIGTDATVQQKDTLITGTGSDPYYVYYSTSASTPFDNVSPEIAAFERAYREFVYSEYLEVDSETRAYMEKLIAEQGFDVNDPEIIEKVALYIQGAAKYNYDFDPALNDEANMVIAFLDKYKEGVCRHYASAATLLYRTLGIPARYTSGYVTSTKADTDIEVTAKSAHAWVEVYEDGLGWRMVEVTGAMEGEGDGEGGGNLNNSDGENDQTIFTIFASSSGTVYLKQKSYKNLVGSQWSAATPFGLLLEGKYSADYLRNYTCLVTDQRIAKISPIIPVSLLPYYPLTNIDPNPQTDDTLIVGNGSEPYYVYYTSAQTPNSKISDEVIAFEKAYREFVYSEYLDLDTETRAYMEKLILEQGFSIFDSDIIDKVAEYIQNSATYNLNYNKSMNSESNVVIAFLESYKEGVCVHYASAATMLFRALGIPARYTEGFMVQTTAGDEIAVKAGHAWVEVYDDGLGWRMVEVTPSEPIKISVKPVDEHYLYDGNTYYPSGKVQAVDDYGVDYVKEGYKFVATVEGNRRELGITKTHITSLTIYDPKGNDVTARFSVKISEGNLQVYLSKLSYSSAGGEFVYDGTPHTTDINSVTLTDGELPSGYKTTVSPTGSITNVGRADASFSVKIYDASGSDVTDHFWINPKCGSLHVSYALLTICVSSAEKVYDGTPLTEHHYFFDSALLMPGHNITNVFYIGEQLTPGRSDNTIDITQLKIIDSQGKDVTANYQIEVVPGTLRVWPKNR